MNYKFLNLKDKKYTNKKYLLIAFAIYSAMAVFANIFLLSGFNMMKWDIMDGYYPSNMFLSNSLHDGVLPLWNPLYDYGVPHYAGLGSPIYYPTTLLFALLGYRLWMVSAEYVIHIILACFGVNLYVLYILKDKHDKEKTQIVALITGSLYGFSTVFLSNAQHIMIIISAAWAPYIFLYIRKYLEENKHYYLLCAAAVMGLSVQGGYPELWIGLVIILVPFFAVYTKADKSIKKIGIAVLRYIVFGVYTLCASAIIIIPTVVLTPYMGRLNGGQKPFINSYEWKLFLSAIIPGVEKVLCNRSIDISMISMYIGLLPIVLLPAIIIKKKNKDEWFALGIVIFSLLMMMGNNSFLHPLFQLYFPMFSSLRFPSVYRCFVSFYALVLCAFCCVDLENNKLYRRVVYCSSILLIAVICIVCIFSNSLVEAGVISDSEQLTHLCIIAAVVLALYIGAYFICNRKRVSWNRLLCIIFVISVFESLVIQGVYFPITIGYSTSFSQLLETREKTKLVESDNRNRLYNADYRNSIRGNGHDSFSGSSSEIVRKNELSEMGYTNVKLDFIENYRFTANRYIIQGNPVFYFTNDVVTDADCSLEDWQNRWDIDSRQIHTEESLITNNSESECLGPYLDSEVIENTIVEMINGSVDYDFHQLYDTQTNRKWKLYIKDEEILGSNIELLFRNNDECISMKMNVSKIYNDEDGLFIWGCFPSHKDISSIDINVENIDDLIKFEYLVLRNESVEDNIIVKKFSPNNINLEVDCDEGYLVTLQSDYPGWNAYVDGQRTEIVRVNGAFRGVYITEGKHEIEYKFVPIDFYVGATVTGIFYIVALVVFLKKKKIDVAD